MSAVVKKNQNSNLYSMYDNKMKAVFGGIPNVKDRNDEYVPFDNDLKIITSHPVVKYVIKQGSFFIGFHNKNTERYISVVKLKTGESLVKTIIGVSAPIPTVINKHTLHWEYANGSWIRECATERQIKETMFQKAGQVVQFKYKLVGFTARKVGNKIKVMLGAKVAFSISRPYYMTQDEKFLSWVPIKWEKVDGNWVVTYPAPAQDSYIDPTIVFGEGSGGQINSVNKCTSIQATDTDQALGGDSRLYVNDGISNLLPLIQFVISGTIPGGAQINSSLLTITSNKKSGDVNVAIHRLLTAWGVDPTTQGAVEEPAASGQATFRRAFDFNGAGGDIDWSTPGAFSTTDFTALAEDTEVGFPAVNTTHSFDITALTQIWATNPTLNFGVCLLSDAAVDNRYYNNNAANLAHRPYLTVDYTIPAYKARRFGAAGFNIGINK
jgi:hypothetical protein